VISAKEARELGESQCTIYVTQAENAIRSAAKEGRTNTVACAPKALVSAFKRILSEAGYFISSVDWVPPDPRDHEDGYYRLAISW
jgi:hypothetical protein